MKVASVLEGLNISLSNIFPNMLLSERFHQKLSRCFWLLRALQGLSHRLPVVWSSGDNCLLLKFGKKKIYVKSRIKLRKQ